MNAVPRGVPLSARAYSDTEPRRDATDSAPPGATPSAARSAGLNEAIGAGSIASSTSVRRVMLPVCQCSS
jgi:hypothetical protein